MRDADAPVHAGCYYHVLDTRGEGEQITHAGYSGSVPAALRVEPDQMWPEATLVSGVRIPASPHAPTEPKIAPSQQQ